MREPVDKVLAYCSRQTIIKAWLWLQSKFPRLRSRPVTFGPHLETDIERWWRHLCHTLDEFFLLRVQREERARKLEEKIEKADKNILDAFLTMLHLQLYYEGQPQRSRWAEERVRDKITDKIRIITDNKRARATKEQIDEEANKFIKEQRVRDVDKDIHNLYYNLIKIERDKEDWSLRLRAYKALYGKFAKKARIYIFHKWSGLDEETLTEKLIAQMMEDVEKHAHDRIKREEQEERNKKEQLHRPQPSRQPNQRGRPSNNRAKKTKGKKNTAQMKKMEKNSDDEGAGPSTSGRGDVIIEMEDLDDGIRRRRSQSVKRATQDTRV